MSNIHLKVEVFGGSNIDDACKEACALADRINITVDFMFNGVMCIANPGTDADSLVDSWKVALKSISQYKFASGVKAQSEE